MTKCLTSIDGSSNYFKYGFITYSNEAKYKMINVNKIILKYFGAVNKKVVYEMVKGAIKKSSADYGISVSGIAGPNGGTLKKPIGTVWFAFAEKKINNKIYISTKYKIFHGNRKIIRLKSTNYALQTFLQKIKDKK
ncbi:nicotinamide-nucleotide amidohydrolase family protein [Candidatus Providencia siddallii]|uniref:nicotinamide-nucleotide amidohydrolase family protein n=1 Tax=Candidatus Providencia siddallii TaxID=1715285 RepID=UPI00312C8F11